MPGPSQTIRANLIRCVSLGVMLVMACQEEDLPDYSGCRLHFVKDNYECVHYCGSSLEYVYDETTGRVKETFYSPAGPNGWNQTHTTYVFDGDTLRSTHVEDVYDMWDRQYVYSNGRLTRIEGEYTDETDSTTSAILATFEYDAEGRIAHVVDYTDGKKGEEQWYFYEDGKPTHQRISSGGLTGDLYYAFDSKVNPEALLGIYPDDPIASFPHNITARTEVHSGLGAVVTDPKETITYKYDASGLPITSSKSIYMYDCN